MKNLFTIIGLTAIATLGVGSIISSTTVQQSVITVKPATPKVTITKAFRQYYNIQDDVEAFIRANVRQGYVVKAVSMAEDDGRQRAIVVMEKY